MVTRKRRIAIAIAICGSVGAIPLASALRAEQFPFKSKVLASGRITFHADTMTHYWVIDFDTPMPDLKDDLKREVLHLWPTWDGPFCKIQALACVMIVDHPHSRRFADDSGGGFEIYQAGSNRTLGQRFRPEMRTASKLAPRHGTHRVVLIQASRASTSEKFLNRFRRFFGLETRVTAEDFGAGDRMTPDMGRRGEL